MKPASSALPAVVAAQTQSNPEVEKGVRALAAELRRTWDARDISDYMACYAKPEGLIIWHGSVCTLDDVKSRVEKAWNDRASESWTNDQVHVLVIDRNTALMQITWSGQYTLKSGATWQFKSSSFGTSLVKRFGDRWKMVASQDSGRGTQVKPGGNKN